MFYDGAGRNEDKCALFEAMFLKIDDGAHFTLLDDSQAVVFYEIRRVCTEKTREDAF